MIDQNGAAIVMDFGIARVADAQHFTVTGSILGTPAYMSPEQCHGCGDHGGQRPVLAGRDDL